MISAFDIATRKTGFCVGTGATKPVCGAFLFPPFGDDDSPDLGGLLDLWDRYLDAHIEEHRPEQVVYEKPILVVNRSHYAGKAGGTRATDKPGKLRKIYSMGAHLEFVCLRRGIECSEVELHAIKREVTGSAQATKQDMVAVALAVGLALPKTLAEGKEDAADAWGAWLLGVRKYNPAASRKWDAAVCTRRGGFI